MSTAQLTSPPIASMRGPLTTAWVAWAVVCVAWGITYELINVGDQWEPLIFTALRFTTAGLILLAFTPLVARRMLLSASNLGRLVVAGTLMFVTGNGFVVWALQTVEPHVVAILVAMIPIYTMVLTSAWERRGHCPAAWLGLLTGMVGVGVLVEVSPRNEVLRDAAVAAGHFSTLIQPHCTLEAAIGVQVGCISWALGSLYATRVDPRIPPVAMAGMQMFAAGILLLLIAAGSGELRTAQRPSIEVIAALATVTLLGSVLAYACYAIAIRHLPLTTVALHAYLSPVVTMTLSALTSGKPPSLPMVASAIVVFAGVALTMRRHR